MPNPPGRTPYRKESLLALDPHGFHRVAYLDWGRAANPHIVICLHGLTRNARDFDWLARALCRDVRVLAFDAAGRGDSDWLPNRQDYGFELYVQEAAALIARATAFSEAPPAVDWIGTSMGGIVGMLLAARAGSPIRRLVLNDVGPTVPWTALVRLKGLAASGTHRFADLAAVEAHLRLVCGTFGPLTDGQWRHLAEHGARPDPAGGYALAYDPGIVVSLWGGADLPIAPGADWSQGVNLWQVWGAIRCDTLVLRGAQSDVLSAATAREMSARGPRARVVEFAGVGHAPALMDAAQIGAVRDFLLG